MLGKRRGLICDLEYEIRHQGEETIDFKLNIETFSHTYVQGDMLSLSINKDLSKIDPRYGL